MSDFRSCIFEGSVVHKRLAPRQHGFSYRVFALALDVDEIDRIDAELRLFSRGRANVLSFRDGDVGAPDDQPVARKIRELLETSGLSRFSQSITLVCYPRLFGYVFNPLSVYFCRDAEGVTGAVVYEVSNTFGERKSYVIPVTGGSDDGASGAITQSCAKEMYVSPFTGADGSYGFHCVSPGERIVIGVNFREGGVPMLKTHFRGVRRPLSDRSIARLVLSYPLMTLKVIGAIHYEAARLWAKGIPIVARHRSDAYSFTVVDRSLRGAGSG